MTQAEQAKLQVLNQVLIGQMTVREVAQVWGSSERHTWRILAAYRKEGAAALVHGNRSRQPANAIPREIRDQVITLARTRYLGFNHTHLTELLAEREGIELARSSVRGILVGAGIESPRRQRMPQEGMLLQLDGSPHAWLGDRGPWLTLLLAVDDATGTVPYALFHQQEDTEGYLLLLQGIIQRCGIPLGVYTDRHAVFRHPRQGLPEETHAGKLTQFGRALKPTPCSESSCHASTTALECQRPSQSQPIAQWTPGWIWMACSVSRSGAEWRKITRCNITGAPCNSSQGLTAPATPGLASRCKSVWTAAFWCPTTGRS